MLVRSCYVDVAVWVRLSCEFAARAIKLHQIASPLLPLLHTSVARGSARARARETQTRTRTIAEFAEALRERGRRGARERGARGNGRAENAESARAKTGRKKRAPPPCARKSLSRSLVLVLVRARAEGCRGGSRPGERVRAAHSPRRARRRRVGREGEVVRGQGEGERPIC